MRKILLFLIIVSLSRSPVVTLAILYLMSYRVKAKRVFSVSPNNSAAWPSELPLHDLRYQVEDSLNQVAGNFMI